MRNTLTIRLYLVSQYLLLVTLLAGYLPYVKDAAPVMWLYLVGDLLAYPFYYLLPTLLVLTLLKWLPVAGTQRWQLWRPRLLLAVSYLMTSATVLLIYADHALYELYEYHFNSFVWNLINTPDGISSLGASLSTQLSYALSVGSILLLNAALLFASHRLVLRKSGLVPSGRRLSRLAWAVVLLLVTSEVTYAYSHATGREDIMQAATVVPFHMQTTSDSTFRKIGIGQLPKKKIMIAYGKLNYPLAKIEQQHPKKPMNIIWLVAESLRWDMLDPEIMGNLYGFSRNATRFQRHYSGGNRTRMGMFSMFYGLYAPYWYAFQNQREGPVLMDVLLDQGYQFAAHTSQSFSYPELRDTVFANVPPEDLHEIKDGAPSWKRDEQNITEIMQFLDQRDRSRPFFGFMFFEATHAPYGFSSADEIRKPFLEDMDYAKLSSLQDPDLIKNRYINAAHSVDRQLGRVFDYLRQNDLLDNTIVLVTGDHGEEFMENGHWGHGHDSKFPEQQIHVPMVLHIPGVAPGIVDKVTSHLDIPATLMPLLGVSSKPEIYSLGGDLYNNPSTEFVVGNYNYAGIINPQQKIVFPFRRVSYFHYSVFDQDDLEVSRAQRQHIVEQSAELITAFNEACSRFLTR